MKKLQKILDYLNKLKQSHPHLFYEDYKDMIDLAESGVKGDIEAKTALKMIYKMCCEHLDSGAYESADSDVSLMCLPV